MAEGFEVLTWTVRHEAEEGEEPGKTSVCGPAILVRTLCSQRNRLAAPK
jgi:hypothetical protein